MSIKDGKVSLFFSRRRNALVIGVLLSVQAILSVVLCVSLAARIVYPERALGAAGVPMEMAYEGRLTDSSGNALGGTGTAYCYRFSIYDSTSGGNKLWPPSTPNTTTSTTTNGVFSAMIGQADTLSSSIFDFSTTSTTYLQTDVYTVPTTCTGGSWESLSPRQQILSSSYAMQAGNIYGSLLKTIEASNLVQVGTALGTPSPVYLGLDWKSSNTVNDQVGASCSQNGLMWYNSNAAISRAMVCEGGKVQTISNTGATTSIGAISDFDANAVTSGTVIFSNSNNVSFGINGNAITASATATTAGGVTISRFYQMQIATVGGARHTNGTASMVPFILQQPLAFSNVRVGVSISGSTTSNTSSATPRFSISAVLYSLNGSTLSSIDSGSNSFSTTYNTNSTASYNGARGITLSLATATTLNPGEYWMGLYLSTAYNSIGGATTGLAESVSMMVLPAMATAFAGLDPYGAATASSRGALYGLGIFTANATAATVAISTISQTGNNASGADVWMDLRNYSLW